DAVSPVSTGFSSLAQKRNPDWHDECPCSRAEKIMISRSNNFSGMGNGTVDTGASQTGTVVKRIWLVDDSREFRILLGRFLEQLGDFECSRQFPSAEAVIDALRRETPPDAILLDFNMGGMTGLDALGPIKALV